MYNTAIKTEAFNPVYPANTQRFIPESMGIVMRYNYIIRFHPNYSNSTKLYKAATLMHELLHAYFFSLVDDFSSGNPNVFDEFPVLFEAFVQKSFPGSLSMAHHQEMALQYVDAISRVLQEYQTGVPVPENAEAEEIYRDLAFGGLQEAPVFNVLFPVGSSDRQRIIGRYNAELVGHEIYGQLPVGNPCD